MKIDRNISDADVVLHILSCVSSVILFAIWARSFADGDARTAFGACLGLLFFSGVLIGWHLKMRGGGDEK